MKKLLKVLGIIFAVLLLVGLGIAGYNYWTYKSAGGPELLQEAKGYAVESIKAISSTWDPNEMRKRTHPKVQEQIQKSGQSFEGFANAYRKLGKLQDEPVCTQKNFKVITLPENYIYADYTCDATYENDKARINVAMRRDSLTHDTWLITMFRIDSPLFTKILEK